MADNTIDKQEFRRALGAFVTGVTIVTTRQRDGRPVGLTANSFNSVSLEPPMVLWSLALDSQHLDAFRHAGWWAVHILASTQEDLSGRFAGRSGDKFAGLPFTDGPAGVPLLEACAARFVCRTAFEYEGGDHAIFVGEVTDMTKSATRPLIYHGGKYGRVMPEGDKPIPIEAGDDGSFGRHFIGHLLGRAHLEVFSDVQTEYRKRGLHASEYTALASLGLGDGCTRAELHARAARGKLDLRDAPIDRLVEKGLIYEDGEVMRLTPQGRQILTELVAVAQATQLKIESQFPPEEMAILLRLLKRIAGVSA